MKAGDKVGVAGFVRKEASSCHRRGSWRRFYQASVRTLLHVGKSIARAPPGRWQANEDGIRISRKMVCAVLKAMRRQLIANGKLSPMSAFDAGPVAEDDERDWMSRQEDELGLYSDNANGGSLPTYVVIGLDQGEESF